MVNKAKKLKELKKEKTRKDKEWKKAVLTKYNGRCFICGETKMPNAHHIIPKNFTETRWDEMNGIILCPKHHKFGKFSAHKHALWFIVQLMGSDLNQFNYLVNKLSEDD